MVHGVVPGCSPGCQVLGCTNRAQGKGGGQFHNRCTRCRKQKREVPPSGVRVNQRPLGGGIMGQAVSLPEPTIEIIAPTLQDAPGPGTLPVDRAGRTPTLDEARIGLPVDADLVRHVTRRDAHLAPLVVSLRMVGVATDKIAQLLDTDPHTIARVCRNERAAGRLDDTLLDLTQQALPAAIAQLLAKIEAGEAWAIKDTLRGLGAFKSYSAQRSEAINEQRRTLHVVLDEPDRAIRVDAKNIVGVPRQIAGAVQAPTGDDDAVPISRAAEVLPQPGGQAGGDHDGGRGEVGPGVEGDAPPRARLLADLAGLLT